MFQSQTPSLVPLTASLNRSSLFLSACSNASLRLSILRESAMPAGTKTSAATKMLTSSWARNARFASPKV